MSLTDADVVARAAKRWLLDANGGPDRARQCVAHAGQAIPVLHKREARPERPEAPVPNATLSLAPDKSAGDRCDAYFDAMWYADIQKLLHLGISTLADVLVVPLRSKLVHKTIRFFHPLQFIVAGAANSCEVNDLRDRHSGICASTSVFHAGIKDRCP